MKICLDVNWAKHQICLREPDTGILTVVWTLHLGNSVFAVKGECDMAVEMQVTEFLNLSVSLVDAFGNPASFTLGSPVWTISDPSAAEMRNMTDDGKIASATFWPLGPVPSTAVRVSFNCDADPAQAGNQPLATEGFLDITLLSGIGVTATIVAGTPTPKP